LWFDTRRDGAVPGLHLQRCPLRRFAAARAAHLVPRRAPTNRSEAVHGHRKNGSAIEWQWNLVAPRFGFRAPDWQPRQSGALRL